MIGVPNPDDRGTRHDRRQCLELSPRTERIPVTGNEAHRELAFSKEAEVHQRHGRRNPHDRGHGGRPRQAARSATAAPNEYPTRLTGTPGNARPPPLPPPRRREPHPHLRSAGPHSARPAKIEPQRRHVYRPERAGDPDNDVVVHRATVLWVRMTHHRRSCRRRGRAQVPLERDAPTSEAKPLIDARHSGGIITTVDDLAQTRVPEAPIWRIRSRVL